jgi:hypothetical protein
MSSRKWLLRNVLLDAVKATLLGALLIATSLSVLYIARNLTGSPVDEHAAAAAGAIVMIFMTALFTSLVLGLIPATLSAVIYSSLLMRSDHLKKSRASRICLAASLGGLFSGLLVYVAMTSDGPTESLPSPQIAALGIGLVGGISGAFVGKREPREQMVRAA